jgi:hypothetical protein
LIRTFSYGAAEDFEGDVVLDPFVGTGTTAAVSKRMGRQYVGIDINPEYVEMAQQRVDAARVGDVPLLLVGQPHYPGKAELSVIATERVGNAGKAAAAKHHRKTYGRTATSTGQQDAQT